MSGTGYKFYNGVDLQGQKGTNAADATAATDLVTFQQLQAAVAGLAWKTSVRASSTTSGTLASAFANGSAFSGVTLATNDRILLMNQADPKENGTYTVNASGAPTRATDSDSTSELNAATYYVLAGTNADTAWTQQTVNPTIGTDDITFAQFGGGGSSYTFGNGLDNSGGTITVQAADSTITVGSGGISTSAALLGAMTRYATNNTTMTAATPITITHSLGTKDVQVQCQLISTGEYVDLLATATGTNTISVVAAAGASSGTFRIIVEG